MDQVLARLRTNLAKIQGITLYMQAAQDITIGGRVAKTMYQYTLNDADPGELNHWAGLFLDRIKAIPGITDLALTTNGFLFQEKGRALHEAGLRRVSFSLDSLDRANFKKIIATREF